MNKETYKQARTHRLSILLTFGFSNFVEKLNEKDYDTLLDLIIDCYDLGFSTASNQDISFEFPNMNNNKNEEV